ncbi:uncharacterized protein LOC115621347 [Scaptodrosophila lebanonensis]|uniref:Uncharacterized protein LOC115621347 n=1 Tax=Drosophila lebanonensis TaxID=7225 RepID=A0A6J2T7C0_DROLE|nr:uncharacterized protein LOC115621347 [Scaptodrosophila lebanonensis]
MCEIGIYIYTHTQSNTLKGSGSVHVNKLQIVDKQTTLCAPATAHGSRVAGGWGCCKGICTVREWDCGEKTGCPGIQYNENVKLMDVCGSIRFLQKQEVLLKRAQKFSCNNY